MKIVLGLSLVWSLRKLALSDMEDDITVVPLSAFEKICCSGGSGIKVTLPL